MYLKSLELHGFKSFPDKTKLTFENGTTVIVGPNGSGKSNISDAMRWVLGEISTKSIRGTKMEDIIFGGADSRKPMGFAEVSVTFDNTDLENRLDCPYDEVTVTRRYYRSGDSEYFINRQAVRLRDIYELFMNTGIGRDGYSIIGQGKIAEIISKKSDERRSIFEDASGIAKYRHKKSETERKLSATEENMTRINDIFVEIESQVGPLAKEAEKAKRAIDLLETKKRVDVQLWLYDTGKLREEIALSEEKFKRSSFDLQTAEEALADFERQNEKLFESSQSNKLESEQLLSHIRTLTNQNHEIESDTKVNENNIEHTRALIASAEESIAATKKQMYAENEAKVAHVAKIDELQAEFRQTQKAYDGCVSDIAHADEEIKTIEEELALALADIRVLDAERVNTKVQLSVIENAQNSDTDKNSSIVSEIESYEKITSGLQSQCASIEDTIRSYEETVAEVDAELTAIGEELSTLRASRMQNENEMAALKLRMDSATQRIDTYRTMDEHFEGYNNSVRFIMKMYAEGKILDQNGVRCARIYGPLSKVISVEDRYVTAIETALGANLQHIVVEDESVAKAAMYALKKAEAGRATFFPLSSMRLSGAGNDLSDLRRFAGFVGIGSELVGCGDKFRNILSSLLGRTAVFDTIDNATTMAKATNYRIRAVTLDGQQINMGGSFTGGSVKQKNGILGRAGEIKRLETELAELEKSFEAKQTAVDMLQKKIADAEDESLSREDKKKLISVMMGSENSRLEQIRAKLDANNTLVDKLRADFESLNKMKLRYEEDRAELIERDSELAHRIEEISAVRSKKDVERHALGDRKEELNASMTEMYIRLNEIRKDIETENTWIDSLAERITAYRAAIEEQNGKIASLGEQIASYEAKQKENREKIAEGETMLAELNEKRAVVEKDSFEFERKLSLMNQRLRDKMNEKEILFRENTQNETRLLRLKDEQDKLLTKLWDEHELTRAGALELGYAPLDAKSRPEAAATQTECKNKLRAIGNVDLDAVNKYNEVKSRYDYMSAQIQDLEDAKRELVKIISQLESEMKTAFLDSFNKINENFNRVFAELFGGGSAELSLTEPEDVLSSGIEIKAAPPGKIIKSMMQLSGGEQSFVAIALFFAILQVNPTPFCILDEIEAALDEVNVARFAEYIKRYSQETQFVLITHRRGTMEAANTLYGVTMPEHGISKVLSLKVEDISKEKEEEWDGIFG